MAGQITLQESISSLSESMGDLREMIKDKDGTYRDSGDLGKKGFEEQILQSGDMGMALGVLFGSIPVGLVNQISGGALGSYTALATGLLIRHFKKSGTFHDVGTGIFLLGIAQAFGNIGSQLGGILGGAGGGSTAGGRGVIS